MADFCVMLVANDYSKMQRFLNGLLNSNIALDIGSASYTFYQMIKDDALEVERLFAL